MTLLCAWLPSRANPESGRALACMGAALKVGDAQEWAAWEAGGLRVGLWELPEAEPLEDFYAPAVSENGRHYLWFAGEAFSFQGELPVPDAAASRALRFRRDLLGILLRDGTDAIVGLNGHYQAILWDARERKLAIMNDRFGALPGYWASSREGFAFAGGVRGVLAAPGVTVDPDPDAIREAVTFGGYRLGGRTNIKDVKMIAGGSVLSVENGCPSLRRYWSWKDILPRPERALDEQVERLDQSWKQAMRRALSGAARPGQTLSGGLDSRAILAEGRPLAPRWTSITYGVPGCDDARFARRAAAVADAEWIFHSIYDGHEPDWLEARSRRIQDTDGLIELGDLMHAATIELQRGRIDVHISGYIGDAVVGPTFADVETPEQALQRLPFYGPEFGYSLEEAREIATRLVRELEGAPARFALFEHKLPQSTNRWSAAWHPFIRVRRPYIDYDLFDFCLGLPIETRRTKSLQTRWLLTRYPKFFRRIPNQKTGLPVGAAPWRVQAERGRRFLWRKAQPALAACGLPARPRIRGYRDEEPRFKAPGFRERIEGIILRPGSVSADLFGRERLASFVRGWFERGDASIQIIGALYAYESYFDGLGDRLRRASKEAESLTPRPRSAADTKRNLGQMSPGAV